MARRIRVLFLNHTAKLGGGELALRAMIRHLDPEQIQHKVLLFEEGPLAKLLAPDTEVHVLPLAETVLETRKDTLGTVGFSQLRKLGSLGPYVARLAAAIRRLNVDLVHTNSLKSDILGGLAARLAGIPVVWHIRDRIEDDYLPHKVVRVFRQLTRWLPQAVIANSQATMDSLHLSLPRHEDSRPRFAEVVHDGFDFGSQPPGEPRWSPTNLVGLVGRISPWKGQDVFLRAVHLLHDDFPKVRFQLIGSALFGEEAYEAELRALSKELGLQSCVEFCGFVHNVQERMAALSLVVHASTLSEPFGQVVIEGMAAGKPVIATRGGGVSEIVIDGLSGLLVPKRDPAALAAAMRTLLSDPARSAQLGAAGYRRVQESFRIEATAAKATNLYRRMVTS